MTDSNRRGSNQFGAATPARPRPILMIPLRRCGSHALRLRLNFSPEFYSPYPLHIVDFMPLVPLYGDLRDDRRYFELITDVIGLQSGSLVKWAGMTFEPAAVFDAIKDQPRSVHRVVWELLFEAGRNSGARVVMDKSLDSVLWAEELMALFPDMLFLNVVRDPRAQVASMNRAIIHDFDSCLNALTWVQAHDRARALAAKYPQRVLTIRYEDFLANQEAVLRRICEFFGIAFDIGMLDVAHSAEAQQIAGMSALWESNHSAPIKANADKFKKSMTPGEIEIVETLARGHMDYYGYERMTAAEAVITTASIQAAREHSEVRRREAWKELEQKDYRDYVLRRFRADYLQSVRERLVRNAAPSAEVRQPWALAAAPAVPAGTRLGRSS